MAECGRFLRRGTGPLVGLQPQRPGRAGDAAGEHQIVGQEIANWRWIHDELEPLAAKIDN